MWHFKRIYRTKRFVFYSTLFGLCLLMFSLISYQVVKRSTKEQLYFSMDNIKEKSNVLVLGTAKNIGSYPNLFFDYRIEAAFELYQAGKVSHFILSGDNHVHSYNEPEDMRQALLALGVPDSMITLDYAGFRTFDSMVRSLKVFGQDKLIVVSQAFHLERALFIANQLKIDAIGYCAKDVSYYRKSMVFREHLARAKAVLDLYVLNTQPKFLGPKIHI